VIVVVDLGGQYAHLIVNRIRRLGVKAELFPLSSCEGVVNAFLPSVEKIGGIIFSGGGGTVVRCEGSGGDGADSILELVDMKHILSLDVPVLGLCLGHQFLAAALGGRGESVKEMSEYGPTDLTIAPPPADVPSNLWLLHGTGRNGTSNATVWMSHSDSVVALPPDLPFHVMANTSRCAVAAYAWPEKKIYGLQFHPEVTHSENGMQMLHAFTALCTAAPFSIGTYLNTIHTTILNLVKDRKVFIFVSGGVDSSVAFALLARILGKERCYGLLVDHGLLRKDEAATVVQAMREIGFDNLHLENASEYFLGRLKDVYDPEEKRKIIGECFLHVKEDVARRLNLSDEDWLLGQGTIYPDTIETGGTARSSKIKTHHNRIAAFDEMIRAGRLVEPLRDLYKDEVRALGRLLGLPPHLIYRHPFPGPGLGVRILCAREPFIPHSLSDIHTQTHTLLLRSSLSHFGFCTLPVRSVGVQGDNRSYKASVCLVPPVPLDQITDDEWIGIWKVAEDVPNYVPELNRVLLCLSHRVETLDLDHPFHVTPSYVTSERADKLRGADHVVTNLISEFGLYDHIWQFPVVLLPLGKSEGNECVVLRPVESAEAMTASAYRLDVKFLKSANEQITAIPGIDTVLYDLTSKPPGTIEWE